MKYTFSDEEDVGSDALSTRRSNRQSGISTPAEHEGPTYTASGRQVKSRLRGAYGESLPGAQRSNVEQVHTAEIEGGANEEELTTRSRVKRTARSMNNNEDYNSIGSMDDESDATPSGEEWDGGGDDEEPDDPGDEEEDLDDLIDDTDSIGGDFQRSLVVSLRYRKTHSSPSPDHTSGNQTASEKIEVLPIAPSDQEKPDYSHVSIPEKTRQSSEDVPPSIPISKSVSYTAPIDCRKQDSKEDPLESRIPENTSPGYRKYRPEPELKYIQ